MSEDISGFGSSVRVLASNTFPAGFELTQFADDADAIDAPALDISGNAVGLNGDLVTWTSANPIPLTINLITNSQDDRNMNVLFEANRAGKNKASAKDKITLLISYADGSLTTLTGGSCVSFIPAKSIASEGRFKTNPYAFAFENRISTL